MMKPINVAVAAICIAALPMAALAEKGGNGNGNGNRGQSAQDNRGQNANRGNGRNSDGELNRANGNSANARANPSQGFCPPGLRKRDTGCVPPGEAANGTTAAEWAEKQGYRYVAGTQLEPSEYTLLPNYGDYDLPDLDPGEAYAVINRTAVVIEEDSGILLRVATR